MAVQSGQIDLADAARRVAAGIPGMTGDALVMEACQAMRQLRNREARASGRSRR